MKLKTLVTASVAAIALGLASSAAAAIVDFDGVLAPVDFSGSSFSWQGLDFAGPFFSYVWTGDSPNSNGTNNLIFGPFGSGNIAITRTGGGLFSLQSFDMSVSWYSGVSPNSVLVNANPLTIDSTYTTYNVNLTNVSSVTISGLASNDGYWQADNFVYTAGVPEPATWALMIGGFGMAGGMIRRRKTVTA